MATTAVAVLSKKKFAPSLAMLPDPGPRGAIVSSFLGHCALLVALPFLLMLLPKSPAVVHQTVEMVSLRTIDPLPLRAFPRFLSAGAGSGEAPATPKVLPGSTTRSSSHTAASSKPKSPEAVYAGLVEIHSQLPHATNRVQTILRPDLVNPPKLKFPVRLPSMVVVPSPAAPSLAAPPQKRSAETSPPQVPVVAQEALEKPALPMPASPPHPAGSEGEPSAKQAVAKPEPAPAFPDTTALNPKTALVINAVEVPDTSAAIPDAEIAGNFSVVPSKAGTQPTGSGSGNGIGGTGTSNASNDSGKAAAGGAGNGPAPGIGAGSATGGPAAGGVGIGTRGPGGNGAPGRIGSGNGEKVGTGTGSTSGPGAGGSSPGITIIGGTGGGGTRPSTSRTRPGYGLTIVSGGSSGGASRDMGVFARNETVYSVYISMADAGGGPDWPMQYALADPAAAGNGLVSPPYAMKKVAAEATPKTSVVSGARIFLAGVITATGELRDLRPLHFQELGSQLAMDALQKWQFAPAEVNGHAVETKVLIGVTIVNFTPANSSPGTAASQH
jgi:hypothetical protein